MKTEDIEKLCKSKEQKLLNIYFSTLIKEAAIKRLETIYDNTNDLPLRIEEEHFPYLQELWDEINLDKAKPLETFLDKRNISMLMTDDDREGIHHAYEDATRRTLWEHPTKPNQSFYWLARRIYDETTKVLVM